MNTYMRSEERMLNAGADIVNYMPVTFNELIACNNRFKADNEPWDELALDSNK